jgi:hypothetical protein
MTTGHQAKYMPILLSYAPAFSLFLRRLCPLSVKTVTGAEAPLPLFNSNTVAIQFAGELYTFV